MIPDDAPPLAYYSSPYGGLGLKVKSYVAARRRIEGLLAIGREIELSTIGLTVYEPASRALVEALAGSFDRDVAFRGGGDGNFEGAIAASSHAHDEVAGEAWRRFGRPNRFGGRQTRDGWFAEWGWEIERDAERARRALDEWSPFVAAHDQLMLDDYSTRLAVRAIWNLRLCFKDDRVVAAPYPPSRISAHLCGRHASAFFDLVLPHTSADDQFLADYQAINCALGMQLPMGGFKLSTSKKKGSGRVFRRLPD